MVIGLHFVPNVFARCATIVPRYAPSRSQPPCITLLVLLLSLYYPPYIALPVLPSLYSPSHSSHSNIHSHRIRSLLPVLFGM